MTFALLASSRHTFVFDASTAYTTIAILALVTHPANMVMTVVPKAIGMMINVERLEAYLNEPDQDHDKPRSGGNTVVQMSKASFCAGPENTLVLNSVDLVVQRNTIVVCLGPVGSGKTSLLKAIQCELKCATGDVWLSYDRTGLCSQIPWLPQGSVKDAILGPTKAGEDIDHEWYQAVLDACCLDADLQELPHGDQTDIGSRGINLSGGQRQRVVSPACTPRSMMWLTPAARP